MIQRIVWAPERNRFKARWSQKKHNSIRIHSGQERYSYLNNCLLNHWKWIQNPLTQIYRTFLNQHLWHRLWIHKQLQIHSPQSSSSNPWYIVVICELLQFCIHLLHIILNTISYINNLLIRHFGTLFNEILLLSIISILESNFLFQAFIEAFLCFCSIIFHWFYRVIVLFLSRFDNQFFQLCTWLNTLLSTIQRYQAIITCSSFLLQEEHFLWTSACCWLLSCIHPSIENKW